MRILVGLLLAAALLPAAESVHEFTLGSMEGKPASRQAYNGKVVLSVNVASRCGYTPIQRFEPNVDPESAELLASIERA
jgi:glutathione peroxidase-family protein